MALLLLWNIKDVFYRKQAQAFEFCIYIQPLCIKYCYMCLLVSQFLDINWTGLTNMLDIPGIKWVIHVSAITHHLIILCQFHKTGEWIRLPLKCTRAVTWPILYFEVAQITVSHTNIIHAHSSLRNAALPVRPHQTIHVYTHLWWWGNDGS